MKYSYGECVDMAEHGTSGDQVWDILESWKADAYNHLQNIHELQQELARLREERRWIPVSEMLPEVEGDYLVVIENPPLDREIDLDHYNNDLNMYGSHWEDGIFMCIKYGGYVTHWMPLPEFPEAE